MQEHDRPRETNAAAFKPDADDVFGRLAGRYDLLCDIFSLGLHRRWKRRVARMIADTRWERMLDAAAGTGHIVTRVLARSPGIAERRHIIVSDISAPMLAISQRKTAPLTNRLDYRILDAETMPSIASGSLDLYSMSLGLKICDRAKVLQEAHRVLKPGGRIVTLEASAIRWTWLHRLYLTYMNFCMPLIGRIATGGDASAYQYLLKGVHGFPDAEGLAAEMRALGFEEVRFERMSLGIVAIHSGVKTGG
ncbi:MAG: ubiquinone/menaquinone biosynthesis methyltransferase [Hyphomicrobiaceae bacterium]